MAWVIASIVTTVLLGLFIVIATVTGLIVGPLLFTLTVTLIVLGTASLIAAIIGWAFKPREVRDHYEVPFGDYPKVTR